MLYLFVRRDFVATCKQTILGSGLFGKLYFPRLAVPISTMIGNLITFTIQKGA